MAVNTLHRDYDIARIIDDYERRISFLERQIRNMAYLTPEFTRAQSCRVTHSVNQSAPNATFTTLAFNTEIFDNAAMHSNVTNNSRITAPVSGFYTMGMNVQFSSAADYTRMILSIVLNGGTRIAFSHSPGTSTSVQQRFALSTGYPMEAGDYIEAQVYQQNVGSDTEDIETVSQYSPQFWATRVGS